MTDRQVILVAACVWLGAWVALPIHPVAVGLIVFVGWWWRRGLVIACAAGLLASMLAAEHAPEQVDHTRPFVGEIVLRSDPEPITRGLRFDVDASGVRLEAVAFGSPAGELRSRLLGERVQVTGSIDALDSPSRWLELRGIQGRLSIGAVDGWQTGRVHHRLANAVRRTISRGAEVLPRDQQVLLVGLVYGDDRHHSAVQRDDFAGSGLTHLLAVSGQNVAFTLVLFGPMLRRFDYRGRFVLTLLVLFGFATLTRFEPSVLRASAMAAVAALAVVTARQTSSVRALALAVSVVVLVTPSIVSSVGFQLSVIASLGILLIAPRLSPVIRAPRVLAEAIAVTTGAQLAVAPLLLWRFDEVPVASLPANIAAGPVAGPVMMWGLTAGLLAGAAPAVAPLLHAPTGLGVGWIQWVASTTATLPLGTLPAPHLVVLTAGALGAIATGRRWHRRAALLVMVIALSAPAVSLARSTPSTVRVDGGAVIWQDRHSVVIDAGGAGTEDLIAALRRAGVRRADLVVLPRGNLSDWDRLRAIRHRVDVAKVWTATDRVIPDAIVPPAGTTVWIDDRVLDTTTEAGQLALIDAN